MKKTKRCVHCGWKMDVEFNENKSGELESSWICLNCGHEEAREIDSSDIKDLTPAAKNQGEV